jgi:signal transduction histidine kinase
MNENMSANQEILIFTDRTIRSISPNLPIDHKIITKYKLTSKLHDFQSGIENTDYSLIIVDSDNDISPADLRRLMGLAKQKSIPVVFGNLQDDPPETSLKEDVAGILAGKSITLHRKGSEPVAVEKENIQVVNETAATLSHEINNPLMTITANIEVLLNGSNPLPNDVRKKMRLIGRAAYRIKAAIEKLTHLDSLSYKSTIAGRMINLRDSTDRQSPRISKIAK